MIIKMVLTNAFNIDVRVYKEARYLVSKGNDVEIICWDKTPEKGLPEEEIIDGIQIKRFGIPSIAGTGYKQIGAYRDYIKRCKDYLENKDFDVLHCHDIDGALIGRIVGKKYVFDMHEFYDRGNTIRRIISHHLARNLAKHAIANIHVAAISVKTYGKGIEDKFFLLKNYSDPSSFTETTKTQSEQFRISYIGMVRGQIPEFTALFESVRGIDNAVVNVYGGGTDLEKLQELQKEYSNVMIHGPYDGIKESEHIYKNTDVSFVAYDPSNPNYQNEFEPVKLYEAIITGTPIIATESINPGRLAKEKGIGVAVNTQDSKQIKEAIETLMIDRSFYDNCVKNMREMSTQYNWNEAVKVLDLIY